MLPSLQYAMAIAMTLHIKLGTVQEKLDGVGTLMDTRTFRMERKTTELRNIVQSLAETLGTIDDQIEFSIRVRPLYHKLDIVELRAKQLGQQHWESMIAFDGDVRDGQQIFYRGRKSATSRELQQRMEELGQLLGQCTSLASSLHLEGVLAITSAFPPKRHKR